MLTPPECRFLLLKVDGSRLDMTFNRPDQRNAINVQMGKEITSVVSWLAAHADDIRLLVLRGAGGHFCAGGDIKERRIQAEVSTGDGEHPVFARNRDAGLGFLMFERLPQTTIAVVEGSAFGGGMGYACLADITVLSATARMGLPETTLGVAPAQIAPYLVKRIGLTRARQLALTGERFDGATAYRYGVGQYLAEPDALEATLEEVVSRVMRCGPKANAVAKQIMLNVGTLSDEELVVMAAELFVELNSSGEGKEGQAAFAEKRKPAWQID